MRSAKEIRAEIEALEREHRTALLQEHGQALEDTRTKWEAVLDLMPKKAGKTKIYYEIFSGRWVARTNDYTVRLFKQEAPDGIEDAVFTISASRAINANNLVRLMRSIVSLIDEENTGNETTRP